jgi:hypothetical protein
MSAEDCDFNFEYASHILGTPKCQFHQHSKSSFCANILVPKKYKPKMKAQKSCVKKSLA